MALLNSLPEQSHPKKTPPKPKQKNQPKQKQKPKPKQKPPSSWDQIKNLLSCKQIEGSRVHDPSKPNNNNGYSKLGSSCSSICSFRDVVHGNTRVVHRSDNSSPESSILGQETSLLKRKPVTASSSSTSTRSASCSGKSSNGGGNYTSSSSSRGMQFRKLSGCYECHMIVDPSRLPIPRSTLCRCDKCGEVFPKIESLELHQAVRHAASSKFETRRAKRTTRVYIITMFYVLPNLEEFMSTSSAYRIVFHQDTDLMATTCSAIPECRLSLMTSSDILKRTRGCSYAVDVIGLLTAMHHEYFVDATNRLSSVLKFELTDERSKFECALYGKYIGHFHGMLKKVHLRLPVVVIQFARVIAENGMPVVCAEKDITKVALNPTIPEVTQFHDRLLTAGPKSSIVKFNPNFRMCEDVSLSFDKMYPKKSIKELLTTPEGGFFVVCARIVGFMKVDQWFYPVCDCNSFMGNEFGFYLCDVCHRTSFNVTPKFRFEVSVEDDGGVAVFHILDHILLGISSLKWSFLDRKLPLTRGHLQKLNGRQCMFLVKKDPAARLLPGYGFDVLRVSDDSKVVRSYYDEGRNYTPNKATFQPSFEEKGPMPVLALRAPPIARRVSPPERIVYRRRGLKKVCTTSGQSSVVSGCRKSNRILARRKLLSMFDKLSAADKSNV